MENKIYNYLLEKGCCKACCLRFLGDRYIDFNNIEDHIKKKGFLSCDLELGPLAKKTKVNPCLVCLGLLEESVMDTVVNKVLLSEVQKYDTTVFTCSVSFPAAVLLREHTIRLMLQGNFPEFYIKDIDEVALNKTWKWIIKEKLSQKLNRTFENSDTCNFSVNVIMEYGNNKEELSILKDLITNKKSNGEIHSRKLISHMLSNVLPEDFKKVVKIPPEIPTEELACKGIECKHNSVYLAGRYCKYSRELSQSPWIIDGIKTMETSVEEIIFEQIGLLFNIPLSYIKFSASGREDCDVRCLGKGRPFYIELLDPKKTNFTFEELRVLESKINSSTLINVRDLQSVQRSELTKIKEGEQLKTKDYIALCSTTNPVTQLQIDKINNYGSIELEQKTPIRVLHRRPLAVRKKKIHEMKANIIPGKEKLFELHVITEAGTYVKEFVHGDFGRTKPCIGNIIDEEVDIIALDVVAINLDWPKEVM